MKFFNWVQKRFHHNVLKDGVAGNVTKTDSIAIDSDAKALLQHVALPDMLDGWQDGILTIGTFGFSPLKTFAQKNDNDEERYVENNDTEDAENDGDEEVNQLKLSAFEHGLEGVEHATYVETDVMMMVDGICGSTVHEIKLEFEATEGNSGELRRRTTLADLFSEESDTKKNPCPLELDSNSCKKPPVRTKNGRSFAKKLIPQVGQDSSPIKMLHQMVRRMLKRKIHPELQGKGKKLEGNCKANVMDALAKKTRQAAESVQSQMLV